MKTKKIVALSAFKIYAGIALFFLIMKVFGLEKNMALRMFNFVIVIWGINSAIRMNIFKNQDTNYLSNIFIGIATSMIAVFASAVSLFVYAKFISPNFVHVLESSMLWGDNLSVSLITIVIFFEGTASSVISSFIVMQYWKNYKVRA